jgi:hypothetical protein
MKMLLMLLIGCSGISIGGSPQKKWGQPWVRARNIAYPGGHDDRR